MIEKLRQYRIISLYIYRVFAIIALLILSILIFIAAIKYKSKKSLIASIIFLLCGVLLFIPLCR